MICATCTKVPRQQTVATKTRKVGKHTIVVASRQALVCDCGVLAWDPAPAPSALTFLPRGSGPIQPPPLTPGHPLAPTWSHQPAAMPSWFGWIGKRPPQPGDNVKSTEAA